MKDNNQVLTIYLYSYSCTRININDIHNTMLPLVRQKVRMQRRRERKITILPPQYGVTVHLFIGMGRSPDKITFIPFTFTLSYNTSYQGLSSFSPLGRFRLPSKPKLLEPQLRRPSMSPLGCIFISQTFIMRELSSQSRSFL
jgi:hypothetical protein